MCVLPHSPEKKTVVEPLCTLLLCIFLLKTPVSTFVAKRRGGFIACRIEDRAADGL